MANRILLSAMLTISAWMIPGAAEAARFSPAIQHARQARLQAERVHCTIQQQFRLSPIAPQMCALALDIKTHAYTLEQELLVGCEPSRARHLARVIDRKTDSLNNAFCNAQRRALRGIDPPLGCTLAFEAQLQELCETAECLRQEVRLYQPHVSARPAPVTCSPTFVPLRQPQLGPPAQSLGGPGRPGGPNQLHRQPNTRSSVQLGPRGVSFQSGSFRVTLGR